MSQPFCYSNRMNASNRPAPKDEPEDRIMHGILYACAAFFLFTVMQVMAKLLTGEHHVVEIAFYRNFIALIPFAAYIFWSKRFDVFATDMPFSLASRVIVGTIGLMVTFGAVQHLPLSNATVIFFAATLLVPIGSHFFLKEYVGIHRWTAIIIGMVGVIIVAQPTAELTMIGVCLALAAACTHAFTHIVIRHMKRESTLTITFYFIFGGAVIPGLMMPWFATLPSLESCLILLAVGMSGGIAQFFLTRSFQLAPASLLAPFGYTGLLWSTGFDILIWQYIPGWPVFLGGAIIISANLYIIYREKKKKKTIVPEGKFINS